MMQRMIVVFWVIMLQSLAMWVPASLSNILLTTGVADM